MIHVSCSNDNYSEKIKSITIDRRYGCERNVKIELNDGKIAALTLLIPTIERLISSISRDKIIDATHDSSDDHLLIRHWHSESRSASEIFDHIFGKEPTDQKVFKKIELTLFEKVRNFALIVFSAGIFLAFQQYRFTHALKHGDHQTASSALRYGACPHLSKVDIWKIAKAKDFNTLRFLVAQQSFRKFSPFIEARDQLENGETRQELIQILPFCRYPETFLVGSPEGWGERDDYSYGEIQSITTSPCRGHSYDSDWNIPRQQLKDL